MNVTQANAVNVLTRALGVEYHREPPTDVETRAALNVLGERHRWGCWYVGIVGDRHGRYRDIAPREE